MVIKPNSKYSIMNALPNSQSTFTTMNDWHQMAARHTIPKKGAKLNGRAIQTFKRHFLSILAMTNPSFPLDY